jgi:hypothetical protein
MALLTSIFPYDYVIEKIYQVPPEEIKEMVMDFMILPEVMVSPQVPWVVIARSEATKQS